ncbi:MAG: hypothetical protein VYB76_05830 [Chloroflexota bacterium]|nr:hypothetical protein [Chloroflexota bacterium]
MLNIFSYKYELTKGYLLTASLSIISALLISIIIILLNPIPSSIDGFQTTVTNETFIPISLVALTGILTALSLFIRRQTISPQTPAATASSIVGLLVILLLGATFSEPAWSATLLHLNLIFGSLVLGGAFMAMLWGHWYLTSGSLPKEPMVSMALFTLVCLILHSIIVIISSLLPASSPPENEISLAVLHMELTFWLRIGVGLIFPIAATWLALHASRISGMMSTTGLLYLALGALLGGETLGRALFFITAVVL